MDRKNGNINNTNNREVSADQSIAEINPALLPILIAKNPVTDIDEKTVDFKYYNSFNFSKLASSFKNGKITLGVTSTNKGEGKTLVASNMAVSLASGYQQKTLLVDMNFNHPSLHTVFNTELTPGVAEAIIHKKIGVLPTGIRDLYLLTAGDCKELKPGIEHTLILRQILYTLKNKFDFVIIDMSSILPVKDFPVHFINEIDGLITVIDNKSTKKGDFKKIFKHIEETQFVGYIFNRYQK